MADPRILPDRFKAEMPHIPGVSDARPQDSAVQKPASSKRFLIGALLIVTCSVVVVAGLRMSRSGASSLPAADALPLPESSTAAATSEPPLPSAPGPIATTEELAKPWTSKKFNYVRPDTHETVSAMVIRLPGVAGDRSNAYWAFGLVPPFGRCDMDYVTDPKELSARYGYSTNHPMLAAACNGSLYDPLRMGVIGSGAWVRGEVAQGPGIRPPTAIRIQVTGHSIIADRIE